MSTRILSLLLAVLALSLTLAACYPIPITGAATLEPEVVAAAVQQTVSALQTQAAVETLVAELTRVAQSTQVAAEQTALAPTATATASPTDTPPPPTPTVTPLPATATPVPPTPVPPTPTATPLPCLWVQFVKDVTVPDGTVFSPNTVFLKTWRLKNIGSCSWTTDFDVIFDSGAAMSGPAAVDMPGTVQPGETIDVTVQLVAPSSGGKYTGYWKLRSPNGVVFGLGARQDGAFWVQIQVQEQQQGTWDKKHPRDFAYNYCAAVWSSSKGALSCPSPAEDFSLGSVRRSSTPKLEGGYQDDEMAILLIPSSGESGYIEGRFPPLTVKDGDRFRAVIGCLDNSPKCDVTFELNYRVSGGSIKNLGRWAEVYDGKWTQLDVNLSSLAGKKVEFILKVKNNGSSKDDRAFWMVPAIFRP